MRLIAEINDANIVSYWNNFFDIVLIDPQSIKTLFNHSETTVLIKAWNAHVSLQKNKESAAEFYNMKTKVWKAIGL